MFFHPPVRSLDMSDLIRIEHSYLVAPDVVWRLWTTPEGIESWWAPDGFTADVRRLDVRPGGELRYAITATAPAQMEFMRGAGMPLTTESRKTFTEVEEPRRIAYLSWIDFVPGVDPYEHLTTVELTPRGNGVDVVMEMEPLQDDVWTERLVAGRRNELENLARVLAR
jgi:uncharacterized protein YndB with AHSA1/START domain